MLNRRQFVQSLFSSLGALAIPTKTKPLSFGVTDVSNTKLGLSLVEKLEQGYLLLIPYNQSPLNFVQNINTPVPILTNIVDTYNPSQNLAAKKTKIWQFHCEKFQDNGSMYHVWKIRTMILSSSQVAKNVRMQHWNLWEKKNDAIFSKLGTVLLANTGQNNLVQEVYEQGGGVLVTPSVEVYSYKGSTQISLTQLNEIASSSTHLSM